MKYQVTKFKNLHLALKELEPFIRNGKHLHTGRGFKSFGNMRSRECLANWLLCVAINSLYPERLTFTSAPTDVGGDGIIIDLTTQETWITEHVAVLPPRDNNTKKIETLILDAVADKSSNGEAYASGKTLVVFLDAGLGEWFPNKIAQQLPKPLLFEAVWVVGLHAVEEGEYIYNVTRLDLSRGRVPIWRVRINKDFDSWNVNDVAVAFTPQEVANV